jgi:hypothetical protein
VLSEVEQIDSPVIKQYLNHKVENNNDEIIPRAENNGYPNYQYMYLRLHYLTEILGRPMAWSEKLGYPIENNFSSSEHEVEIRFLYTSTPLTFFLGRERGWTGYKLRSRGT